MLKKFIVTALAVAVMAVLLTSPAEAGGPQNQSGKIYNNHWAVQTVKILQFRFAYMFGVAPADPIDPPAGGWGPGDGTGNDGDGPEDGTGYGPGPEYRYQKCDLTAYRFRQRGQ
jgi:hypothetical protein